MKFPDEIQTVATVLVVDGNRPEWDWIGRAIGETCRFAASIESGLTQAHEWLPSVIVLCEQVQRALPQKP